MSVCKLELGWSLLIIFLVTQDMEIWEMVGLWHYPIPGFFLLAQFCLGVLVALGNLVNNSVFLFLSNEERQLSDENRTEEGTDAYINTCNHLLLMS